MLNAILPKGAPFFDFLLQQNKIMCSVCALIPRLLEQERASEPQLHQEATNLEEEADKVYVSLIKELSQAFITPIDREDILRIGKEQETTIDLLQNLVVRLHVLNVGQGPFMLHRLAINMNEMTLLTSSMLEGLSQKKDSHDTRAFRALRNECEVLISSGLGEIWDVQDITPQAVLTILKSSRAYDRMEQALGQIVELAEAIEEAVMKNV